MPTGGDRSGVSYGRIPLVPDGGLIRPANQGN